MLILCTISVIGIVGTKISVTDLCSILSVDIQRIRLLNNPFRGIPAIFPDGEICLREIPYINCGSPNVLTDGMVGLAYPDLFIDPDKIGRKQFVVWQKENRNRFISIEPTSDTATISTIDLYIYNCPAMGFSLPNLELYGTRSATVINPPPESALEFDLINNDKLSQDDNNLRKVTLRLRMLTTVKALLLKWNLIGLLNVQFLGLSEIVLCADDLLPDYNTKSILFLTPDVYTTTIKSLLTPKSLILTCTVSMQGSFEWLWKKKSINVVESSRTSLFTADGTRTSILSISQPNCADTGTYLCEVRFSGVNDTYSRQFNVSFPGKLFLITINSTLSM